MSNTALEGMEAHPLVAILEQQNEAPVEFRGFLGTGDSHTLHLYPDLTISAWIEIPVNSIVHWERDPTDPRRVRVFVDPKAEVAEITRRRLSAHQSQMSLSQWAGISVDTSRPRLPPYRINTCIGFCEEDFARAVAAALQLFAQADEAASRGQNDLAARLNAQGTQIKQRSLEELTACLERCQPFPVQGMLLPEGGYTFRRPTLEEVHSQILQRVLG